MKRPVLHMTIEQAEANEGIMWLAEQLRGTLVWGEKPFRATILDTQIREARTMNPRDFNAYPMKYHPREALLHIWLDKPIQGYAFPFLEYHIAAYQITQIEGVSDNFVVKGIEKNALHFTRACHEKPLDIQ